jgi:hypothetical protein
MTFDSLNQGHVFDSESGTRTLREHGRDNGEHLGGRVRSAIPSLPLHIKTLTICRFTSYMHFDFKDSKFSDIINQPDYRKCELGDIIAEVGFDSTNLKLTFSNAYILGRRRHWPCLCGVHRGNHPIPLPTILGRPLLHGAVNLNGQQNAILYLLFQMLLMLGLGSMFGTLEGKSILAMTN